MSSVLPEVEGWVKVLGAAVAVIMALAVPLRSWIVEDRRYRAQTLEALAGASKAVVAGASAAAPAGGSMLETTLATNTLTEAVRDIAKAIRESTAADEAAEKDRLATAVEALLVKDRAEREKPGGRR